jgi:acyl-CoA synthetase (AMP-forming)/AMP-acid ligase II
MNLASIVLCHAVARPHKAALVGDAETLDYVTVAQLAGRYAGRLAAAGVGRGDRVGLALADTPDHLILHYAVAWLGATVVPIDHRWSVPEKQAVAQAFDCRTTICMEPIPAIECLRFDAGWRAGGTAAPPLADDDALPVMLSLSSGTTGRPSGSLVSHRELYERWISQWVGIGFNGRDRFLLATPLYFGAGRSFGMSFLAAGGTVIFRPPPATAEEIKAAIDAHAVTVVFLVPTQIRGLLAHWNGEGHALPSVRLLVTSGSATAPHERSQIMARLTPGFVDYYGTSEGGGISVLMPDEQVAFADTVGRPAFRVEVEIVDEQGRVLPNGEVGRLRYRGPGVSGVMVNAAGVVTANAGAWNEPGDLARIMPSGHVQLAGRAKDLIIRGGVNVYPAEVETVLRADAAVHDVCVFGLPDPLLGERIAAAIVARPGVTLDPDAIISRARQKLASYKVPDRIVIVEDLPRNSSGKVLRGALAEMATERGAG